MTKKITNPIIQECPVCERRREVLQELEDYAEGNPQLREGARHEYVQMLDECSCEPGKAAAPEAWYSGKGKKARGEKAAVMAASAWLDKCNVMKDEYFSYNWQTRKFEVHSHHCTECGKRLPLDKKQQYAGEPADWQFEKPMPTAIMKKVEEPKAAAEEDDGMIDDDANQNRPA